MKCKLILLFGILILAVSLVRADLASDLEALGEDMPFGWDSVWKDNCQTRCIDGKCNTILGRTIWVNDSDGTCKPIEQAKSLKNGFYIEYLEKDPSFNLTVSEFNISYIDMTLTFEGNPADYPTFCAVDKDGIQANCDFKIDEKWNEINETTGEVIEKVQLKFQYKWELKQGVVIKGDKVKYEYKESIMGKKFSFGGNSTTIKLQDADTENLDDCYIYSTNPGDEAGARDQMNIKYSNLGISFIKFNISAVPSGQQIDSATLYLPVESDGLESGDSLYVNVHHVYSFPTFGVSGEEWTEGNSESFTTATDPELAWDTRPICPAKCNSTYEDRDNLEDNAFGTKELSVTNMVSKTYNDGDKNISFMLNSTYKGGTVDGDWVAFNTKEDELETKPYLNITYSEAAPEDTTPPTYSDNKTNSTLAGTDILHSLKWTDETGLSGYIFQFCNETDIGGLGKDDKGSNGIAGSEVVATRWKPSQNMETDSISVYIYWNYFNPQVFDVAIYSGNESTPITRLIKDTEAVPASFDGWWNFSLSENITLYKDNYYWLATYVAGASNTYYYDTPQEVTINGYNQSVRGLNTNDGLPEVWNVSDIDSEYGNNTFSIYINYTTLEWVNDSFVPMTGTGNWSNVTKTITSTLGARVYWSVHTNDTSDNWNNSETFSYVTTVLPTCDCPASGNWNITCSDNCDIQACNMKTNNVLINGIGRILSLRNITNATRIRIQGGCRARW